MRGKNMEEDSVTEKEKLQQVLSSDDEKEGAKQVINNGDVQDKPAENEEDNKGGQGAGGVFSHILSNFVSSPLSSPKARDDHAKQTADDLFDNAKSPEKDGSGGGIIDNIVSNLRTPLSDDAAPASDEASMLIYSIIHD